MKLIPESPWKRRRREDREKYQAAQDARMEFIRGKCFEVMDSTDKVRRLTSPQDLAYIRTTEALRRALGSYLAGCECTETTPEPFWIERFPEMTAKIIRAF